MVVVVVGGSSVLCICPSVYPPLLRSLRQDGLLTSPSTASVRAEILLSVLSFAVFPSPFSFLLFLPFPPPPSSSFLLTPVTVIPPHPPFPFSPFPRSIYLPFQLFLFSFYPLRWFLLYPSHSYYPFIPCYVISHLYLFSLPTVPSFSPFLPFLPLSLPLS